MLEYIVAGVIALGCGIVSAVMGVGGGFFYVPTLSLFFGLDVRTAMGTSLAVMIFTSVSASFWFLRQKKILFRIALVMIPPAMICSVLGSVLSHYMDTRILIIIFAGVIILIALEMLVERFKFLVGIQAGPSFVLEVPVAGEGVQPVTRIPYLHLVFWGAIGGFIGGVTGTSGGVIFVPALATIGVPVIYAVATSMFTVISIAVAGTVTHAAFDSISLPFVISYGVGAAVGAYLGTAVATRINDHQIRHILGGLLLAIAILLICWQVL